MRTFLFNFKIPISFLYKFLFLSYRKIPIEPVQRESPAMAGVQIGQVPQWGPQSERKRCFQRTVLADYKELPNFWNILNLFSEKKTCHYEQKASNKEKGKENAEKKQQKNKATR